MEKIATLKKGFGCLLPLLVNITFADTLQYDETAVFTDPDRVKKVAKTADAVDKMFQVYANSIHAPGLVYAVVLDGKIVYSGEFGYTNIEKEIKATSKSQFRIASMSKSVTAIAILQLRDAGKLNLDDPVSKYVPEMANLKNLTEDSPTITIRHLLTHDAGFSSDDPWGDRQLAISDNEFRKIINEGVSFSEFTGTQFEYSNLGYSLLGLVVQQITKQTFEAYTTANILRPLGMHDTVWEFDKADSDRLALGYDWIDEAHVNIPLVHHGAFGPMGGLITTIEDFAKYAAFHLSAWPPRDDPESPVLKRSSLREMHRPKQFTLFYKSGSCPVVQTYTYGLSWTETCDIDPYLSHSGGLPGFGSNWMFSPQYGLAILAFDNITYQSPSRQNRTVYKYIIKEAGLKPYTNPPSKFLRQRKDEIYSLFQNWEDDESAEIFAENFFMDNRKQDVVNKFKESREAIGKIVTVSELDPENQLSGAFIIEGEKQNLRISFSLSPEKAALVQALELEIVDDE